MPKKNPKAFVRFTAPDLGESLTLTLFDARNNALCGYVESSELSQKEIAKKVKEISPSWDFEFVDSGDCILYPRKG